MKLSETTFQEFWDYCTKPNAFPATSHAWDYVTKEHLHIIYDYMSKHKLKCNGRNLLTTFKGEFLSCLSACNPLEYDPTREDMASNMFHEVWCKTEWAVRCGLDKAALGYEAVLHEFGMSTIKALKEV